MDTRKWEVIEDSYWKKSRYIQYPSGLIIGHVRGSNCDSSQPWTASTDGRDGRGGGERVGDYVTERLAKKAVEVAIAKRK